MLKTIAAAIAITSVAGAATATDITGAGSTFAAPIYAKWAEGYRTQSKAKMNYQSIGSGGGIRQIEAGTVDFGASDKPLEPADLAANHLVQFPTIIGGVVPVVNLPGIRAGQVKLTGALLADIYRGVVKRWSDPLVARFNPGLKFPNLPITVVHRSDGSGTTFLFTSYLAMEAPHWARGPGASDSVNWPVGLGGKGNEGVAAFVKQTPGAIGYVEYAYAQTNRMTYTLLFDKAGRYIAPTANAFAAAAAGADWRAAPGFYLLLVDQPGAGAWPITGATFALMRATQTKPDSARSVLAFIDWSFKNGDGAAAQLSYVPLPEGVKDTVRKSWVRIKGPGGKPVYP